MLRILVDNTQQKPGSGLKIPIDFEDNNFRKSQGEDMKLQQYLETKRKKSNEKPKPSG